MASTQVRSLWVESDCSTGRPDKAQAGNHASDQHYGLIDRVHVYLYRSLQDRVEAVPRIRMRRDAVQARCLEINATASERSYRVAATDGNGKRGRAEGRARCFNCSGSWGICWCIGVRRRNPRAEKG